MLNSNKLKELVNRSHYRTMTAFANEMEISSSGMTKILQTGQTKEDTFYKMCDLLSCDPTEIASDDYMDKLVQRQIAETRTGISERIRSLITLLQMSDSEFAGATKIPKTSLSTVLDRDNCNLFFIQKILNAMPDISAEWLCIGRGEMFVPESPKRIAAEPPAYYGRLAKKVAELQSELENLRDEHDRKK